MEEYEFPHVTRLSCSLTRFYLFDYLSLRELVHEKVIFNIPEFLYLFTESESPRVTDFEEVLHSQYRV